MHECAAVFGITEFLVMCGPLQRRGV